MTKRKLWQGWKHSQATKSIQKSMAVNALIWLIIAVGLFTLLALALS